MSSNLVAELAAAGVACSVADGLFHPLDTLKTRLHATPTNLSKVIVDAGGGLRGLLDLWTSGLAATAARALTFAATRVGAYPSVRDAMSSDASVSVRVAAGSLTGALAAAVLHHWTSYDFGLSYHPVRTRRSTFSAAYANSPRAKARPRCGEVRA